MSGSTWGDTWGACWGDTWGTVDSGGPPFPGGSGPPNRQPRTLDARRRREDEEILLLIAGAVAAGLLH